MKTFEKWLEGAETNGAACGRKKLSARTLKAACGAALCAAVFAGCSSSSNSADAGTGGSGQGASGGSGQGASGGSGQGASGGSGQGASGGSGQGASGGSGHGASGGDGPGPDHGGIASITVLTSSTLAPAGEARQGTLRMRQLTTDTEVTPSNVTGEVLSVLFPIDPAPDDGIVVFGDGRPDIALNTATLFPFDFLDHLAVNAATQIKPTLADGTTERVHVLMGYADFEYTQADSTVRTVRVATAEVNGMNRGDKLLDMGGNFEWFDLDTNAFTGTRPANPSVIEDIRDFSDPIRPNLVFWPITAHLGTTIPVVAADFLAASTVESEIDFFMTGAITLVGQTTSNLTAEDAIQAFTLTQVLNGSGDTGFDATGTLVAHP